ncbi:hypothetical protein ACQEU8_13945 [Streptomyces sp. CA-250714]|uniref:hypothetical protein n=1 Tax=Streptomyces sp. CA-250714 TaxID=3240060 RepID=UPI003D92E74E
MPSQPHPLRQRAFRVLLTGRALSLLGDAVVPAALALAVLRATGSASALALVLGCAMVPKLVLLPVGGVLADRLRARTVALTTDLVRCASQLFVGLQPLGGDPSLAVLATAEAVGGTASATWGFRGAGPVRERVRDRGGVRRCGWVVGTALVEGGGSGCVSCG